MLEIERNEIIDVDDGDSIIMAQKLASELGLGVGISSGANFLGALIAQEKLGKDSIVVTIFADDNKKYLSTDLMKKEPICNSDPNRHIYQRNNQTFLPHIVIASTAVILFAIHQHRY